MQGTTSLLNLAAGISNFAKYCPDTDPHHMFNDKRAKHLSYRLSIAADFSVSDDNFHLFRDVVSVACTSHDITVSYLRPISLSHTRIEKLSRKLWLHYQVSACYCFFFPFHYDHLQWQSQPDIWSCKFFCVK